MANWLVIVLISIGAVGFFVLAMSLTLIFKGHHINSEISTNPHMQKMGIKCAVQETDSYYIRSNSVRLFSWRIPEMDRWHRWK